MKTKIIYISGNEVFDMRDIRAAFDEVRAALNLDNQTVLFGVPVDEDDAGIMNVKSENATQDVPPIEKVVEEIPEKIEEVNDTPEIIVTDEEFIETPIVEENEEIIQDTTDEIIETPAPKKRGRPRKEEIVNEPVTPVVDIQETQDVQPVKEEKTIPILSVLSADKENLQNESVDEIKNNDEPDIIHEITEEKSENIDVTSVSIDDSEATEIKEDSEPDLEQLLSEMTPLQEDVTDEIHEQDIIDETESDDISVDATLEQLATEFAESQDKIQETKTSSRSKIGKLRNILPFKQSKRKDQGIGDLFEWGGIAANDEDFSVPGFFTNVASKK